MKRGRRIIIVALVLLAVGGLVALLVRSDDPVYKGKPLSFWLAGYAEGEDGSPAWLDADAAMDHAGTSAIPTLLGLLSARETAYTRTLWWFQRKGFLRRSQMPLPPSTLNYRGSTGMARLGSQASNAVPALVQILHAKYSDSSQWKTLSALGAIGPLARAAVPKIAAATKSTIQPVRFNAVVSLGRIHSDPEVSVPALTYCVQYADNATREVAIEALGQFKGDARVAVPALKEIVQGPPGLMVVYAADALNEIDPVAAKEAVPALKGLSSSDNRYIKSMAERTLKKVQPTEEKGK